MHGLCMKIKVLICQHYRNFSLLDPNSIFLANVPLAVHLGPAAEDAVL